MKVKITDIYYIKGADETERVKVAYVVYFGTVRIVGQFFISPYPIETLDDRVVPAVEEDLSTKKDVVQAVRDAAAAYVGQEIDVKDLL